MTNRYAVVGPPGTGKTTYLKDQSARAASAFGGDGVMICSLTRAAAAEIRSRTESIPRDCVGTLHSFAYRACGCPEVAETRLDEWNTAHPMLALSPSKAKRKPDQDEVDERPAIVTRGDELHTAMEMARHHRRPVETLNANVRGFAVKWQEWLHDTGYLDFTGMIETALATTERAPGNPLALFVDEAQDMSRLEIDLIRHWSVETNTLVAVGDPAQAINTFRGAVPEAFFDVGDASHRRTLGQSFRVPRLPHAMATRWGRSLLSGIEYRPVEADGVIGRTSESMRYAEGVVRALVRDLDSHTGSVLFQAQAGYMLRPLIAVLKQEGVPFHNPNRPTDGSWNPLARRKNSVSTVDRVAAWLDRRQTLQTVRAWLPMIATKGVLTKGAKNADLNAEHEIPGLFVDDEAMAGAFSGDPAWLRAHVTTEYAKRVDYPLAIWRRAGVDGLSKTPRLILGTIHSMKGAEADSVWVCPDLSPAAWEGFVTRSEAEVRRLFYVAITRTRERLTILNPSGKRAACLS
jgi:hypothetical protein